MRPHILAELHDWQAIKQAQALEHAGPPEGAAYLAESKRYGAATDEIIHLREQDAHLSLYKPARKIERKPEPVKAIGPCDEGFWRLKHETDADFARWGNPHTERVE